jgi:hypothetical protein
MSRVIWRYCHVGVPTLQLDTDFYEVLIKGQFLLRLKHKQLKYSCFGFLVLVFARNSVVVSVSGSGNIFFCLTTPSLTDPINCCYNLAWYMFIAKLSYSCYVTLQVLDTDRIEKSRHIWKFYIHCCQQLPCPVFYHSPGSGHGPKRDQAFWNLQRSASEHSSTYHCIRFYTICWMY